MPATIAIQPVTSAEDLETTRVLLLEYAAYLNRSLGEEHICLSDYARELANLPGQYEQPKGVILLAFAGENPAGCVALKPLTPHRARGEDEAACEMKRLWVRPEFRGQSVGVSLTQELISYARTQKYQAMYLDTVPTAMQSANGIYKRLGFQPVQRYNTNPILGANPAFAVEFFRLPLD
jgi:putative acetyltransferase